MQDLPNKKSRIEELQKKLYAKENRTGLSERHALHQKDYDLKREWQDMPNVNNRNFEETDAEPKGFFGKILFIAFLFFAASAIYAGYTYWNGNKNINTDNVDIKILSPISIGGGEKLSLDLIIQNNNQVALETVDLIVEYPVGTKSADDISKDIGRVRENLGDIASGGISRKTVDAVLFGDENEKKKIIFILEYRIPNSTAIFEKKKEFEIALNASPIRLTVNGLKEISSGQELTLQYQIESNNVTDLENVLVRAEYPFGFKYVSSNIEPVLDNNLWKFDTLKPKEKKTIEIKGVMEGQNEEERVFKFETGLARTDSPNEIQAVFSSYIHEVGIKRSFVDLKIEINNNSGKEVTLQGKQRVVGLLTFTNNTNDPIINLDLKLNLTGSVINEESLKTEKGLYDSLNNEIVWNSQTFEELARVEPRQSRVLRFDFEIFDLGTASKTFINPEVRISADVSGSRLNTENTEEIIKQETASIIRFLSDTPITAKTMYAGTFSNSGPIPPVAESETTYTIEWTASNSSNDLSNAQITAKLPNYVSWKDNFLPVGSNITFDAGTREVKWSIGNLKNGIGFSSQPQKVYFQIGFRPSQNQIGSAPVLVSDIKFSANDSFAKGQIFKNADDLTTFLPERGYGDNHQNVIK